MEWIIAIIDQKIEDHRNYKEELLNKRSTGFPDLSSLIQCDDAIQRCDALVEELEQVKWLINKELETEEEAATDEEDEEETEELTPESLLESAERSSCILYCMDNLTEEQSGLKDEAIDLNLRITAYATKQIHKKMLEKIKTDKQKRKEQKK